MQLPDLGSIVLWGVPLIGLVGAAMALVVLLWPYLDERWLSLIRGGLSSVFSLFVFLLPLLTERYPLMAVWGPPVLWAITIGLIAAGLYPGVTLMSYLVMGVVHRVTRYELENMAYAEDCCGQNSKELADPHAECGGCTSNEGDEEGGAGVAFPLICTMGQG